MEGNYGEAKTWHGLARAVRRGLANMRIQAYLTAAAINLKRLAAALLSILAVFWRRPHPCSSRMQRQADLIPIRFLALTQLAST